MRSISPFGKRCNCAGQFHARHPFASPEGEGASGQDFPLFAWPGHDKELQAQGAGKLFIDGSKAGVNSTMVPKLENILAILDAASGPGDITAPSLRLHPLSGNLAGYWAVTVRANW